MASLFKQVVVHSFREFSDFVKHDSGSQDASPTESQKNPDSFQAPPRGESSHTMGYASGGAKVLRPGVIPGSAPTKS
ncbi:hypothetical protein ARMGADRAFT_1017515 [Armillaria gallica]|uniref:Uncharacterized protein n=1 Tax=Armillaria gallica TaxID=47427 RepID=A0A2H3CTC8_ARMGA|nr:hypothetical protein ARMGADRAFT_1017515 [Armillaria gallica]